MFGLMNTWIAGAVLAAVLAGGAWFKGSSHGYEKRDLMCKAEVSEISSRAMEAERNATAQRERGRIIADKLARDLADARAKTNSLQSRLTNEINRSASRLNRALDEQLVRLLNELSPIRESTDGGPPRATAARVDAPPAAPAADRVGSAGRGASSHSVATALGQCRAGYSSCRSQLHGLIDWVEQITK